MIEIYKSQKTKFLKKTILFQNPFYQRTSIDFLADTALVLIASLLTISDGDQLITGAGHIGRDVIQEHVNKSQKDQRHT
jgi:hypothetical protein